MGHTIDLRPKCRDPMTRDAYKQRFLDAGLEQHCSFFIEEKEELREKYRYDVLFTGGSITIRHDQESPAGVTASARVSWGNSTDSIRALCVELLAIAHATDSDLVHPTTREPLELDGLSFLFDDFVGSKRAIGKFLGFCKPVPNPSPHA